MDSKQNGAMPAVVALEAEGIGFGLTKREAFAMAAMQGLAANPCPQVSTWDSVKTAACAVQFADELLAALSHEPQ